MKVLELFAGSRSIGRAAESMGFEVFSVDWTEYEGIDLSIDIGDLKLSDVPFIPDIIWASPDCTTYSIAACSTHRTNTKDPKSEYAIKCDSVNQHWLGLINKWLEINPNLVYFIENPRGMLRHMDWMQGYDRHTVWYCQYGDDRAKPTDIWSNNFRTLFNDKGWTPRPECFNNNKNCHHEEAPRGSSTGTQGRKGSFDRSKIPEQLCIEALESVII